MIRYDAECMMYAQKLSTGCMAGLIIQPSFVTEQCGLVQRLVCGLME